MGALVVLGPECVWATQQDRLGRVAEAVTRAINQGDAQAVEQLFAPAMREAVPPDKLAQVIGGLKGQHGQIVAVERLRGSGLTAVFGLRLERGRLEMEITLDSKDQIIGLFFRAPAPERPVPPRNSTPMRLPFHGEWFVVWGGPTEEDNYHASTRSQRRAVDFVIRDATGSTFRGDGSRNGDYYAYGQDIVAPADGTVVTVIDGVPDNTPGSMNPFSAVGNCIVLRHAELEFSVLAHFQPHSIVVREGDAVKAGQRLGRCGNSGNSSEPHLHFHLQNTAVLQDGTGFAPFFQDVVVLRDGTAETRADYTPLRGDRVRPGR